MCMMPAAYHPPVEHEEDVAVAFSVLLGCMTRAGAELFASEIARAGVNAENMRHFAAQWRSAELSPASMARELDAFADELDALDRAHFAAALV